MPKTHHQASQRHQASPPPARSTYPDLSSRPIRTRLRRSVHRLIGQRTRRSALPRNGFRRRLHRTCGNDRRDQPRRPAGQIGSAGQPECRLKHHLHTVNRDRKVLITRALDGRTDEGRFIAAKRADLVADLGGEDSLSTQERALVDETVFLMLQLAHINAWLAKQPALVNRRTRRHRVRAPACGAGDDTARPTRRSWLETSGPGRWLARRLPQPPDCAGHRPRRTGSSRATRAPLHPAGCSSLQP